MNRRRHEPSPRKYADDDFRVVGRTNVPEGFFRVYASIRTLCSGLIDYAGSFPPAELPLEKALRNFGQYLQEPDGWMLGRFVCPAERLSELVSMVEELTLPDRTIAFSVLGRGGQDAATYLKNVEADLADMQTFAGACPGLVSLDTYEVRLPASQFDPIKSNHIGATISTTAFLIEKAGLTLRPFVECPAPHREGLQALLQALQEDQASQQGPPRQLVKPTGMKLRTGGLEPAAFPSPEVLAAVLVGCRKTRVPFKATAGLHHPFRHYREDMRSKLHGFINVFVAGSLSHAHDLPVAEIQAALEDEDPKSFVLDDGGITWHSHRLTNEQIGQAREFFVSFGSCSFCEPRADLREIGWLA